MYAYATTLDYRTYANVTKTAGQHADEVIARSLEEASDWIDRYCGRTFGQRVTTIRAAGDPEVLQARVRSDELYYGNDSRVLQIKPFHGPSSVWVGLRPDDNELETDHWKPVATPDDLSYYLLERLDGRRWSSRQQYVVYAELGSAETPIGIKESVMEMAAIRRIETRRAWSAPALPSTDGTPMRELSSAAQGIIKMYVGEYRLVRV